MYMLQKELNVPFIRHQRDMIPMQKRFLNYAAKHHEEDPPDSP